MVLGGVPIQAALAISFVIALALHFTLNRQWVFTHDSGYALHFSRQGLRYLLAAGLSYAGTVDRGRRPAGRCSASPSSRSSSWPRA